MNNATSVIEEENSSILNLKQALEIRQKFSEYGLEIRQKFSEYGAYVIQRDIFDNQDELYYLTNDIFGSGGCLIRNTDIESRLKQYAFTLKSTENDLPKIPPVVLTNVNVTLQPCGGVFVNLFEITQIDVFLKQLDVKYPNLVELSF